MVYNRKLKYNIFWMFKGSYRCSNNISTVDGVFNIINNSIVHRYINIIENRKWKNDRWLRFRHINLLSHILFNINFILGTLSSSLASFRCKIVKSNGSHIQKRVINTINYYFFSLYCCLLYKIFFRINRDRFWNSII